jgi:hypothetical protein
MHRGDSQGRLFGSFDARDKTGNSCYKSQRRGKRQAFFDSPGRKQILNVIERRVSLKKPKEWR